MMENVLLHQIHAGELSYFIEGISMLAATFPWGPGYSTASDNQV